MIPLLSALFPAYPPWYTYFCLFWCYDTTCFFVRCSCYMCHSLAFYFSIHLSDQSIAPCGLILDYAVPLRFPSQKALTPLVASLFGIFGARGLTMSSHRGLSWVYYWIGAPSGCGGSFLDFPGYSCDLRAAYRAHILA